VVSIERVDLAFNSSPDPAYVLTFLITDGLPDTNVNDAVVHVREAIKAVMRIPPERGLIRIVPPPVIGEMLWGPSILSSSSAQEPAPVHYVSQNSQTWGFI
jgi:hypothetical protein